MRPQDALTECLHLEHAPVGALLVVRADGVKASKQFLKDTLENPDYHDALHDAVEQTYRVWRNWTSKPNQPYLLGALRLSDEVSFIVNRGENYYHRRLLKITSTLASTLSAPMTLAYASRVHRGPLSRALLMAFDGRPLVLTDMAEVGQYIRCRRLLHARNAMTRVLRLDSGLSDEALYGGSTKLADDINRLGREIHARGLWDRVERAAAGSTLYVAEPDGKLGVHSLPTNPNDEAVIRSLDRWAAT